MRVLGRSSMTRLRERVHAKELQRARNCENWMKDALNPLNESGVGYGGALVTMNETGREFMPRGGVSDVVPHLPVEEVIPA